MTEVHVRDSLMLRSLVSDVQLRQKLLCFHASEGRVGVRLGAERSAFRLPCEGRLLDEHARPNRPSRW